MTKRSSSVPAHHNLVLQENPNYQHIKVKPVTLALGALVSGVNISDVCSDEVYAEIGDALWRYHVLFFHEQALTSESHLALAKSFGNPELHEIFEADKDYPEISILLNDEDRPPEINTWHTDTTFREKPSLCTILYCQVMPEAGGDTMWLNQNLAFETLSQPIKNMLLELVAEHDILNYYSGTEMLEGAGGEEKGLERLEVAVVLGGDPTTIWTGALPIPPDMDELAVAGIIRDTPVEMVKCRTIDLEVPAHSEFVLEGYVVPGELKTEGPFGDHTGYYSMEDDYPVFHLSAVTHRKDAIYPATVVGRPPSEDFYMGKAVERLMLPALQMALPEVKDMNMPAEGAFHNLVIVSVKKEYPGHTRKVMNALWGLGLMMLAKTIIVVDDYVDVQNLSEVAWRVASNIDPENDVMFVEGPVDDLDHSSTQPKFGSKMGIDATAKTELDGRNRDWPPDVVMSEEITELVTGRWKEYGL